MRTLCCFLLLLTSLNLNGQIRFEADFNTAGIGSAPTWLTPFDGRIFFSATDGYSGREAWVYDPAINQAYRLGDINQAAGNANPNEATVFNGVLYFVATSINEQQLWQLRPNENRAEKVVMDSLFREIESLTVYANALYFKAKYQGDLSRNVYLHRYLASDATDERVTNSNEALELSSSFGAMCVHNEQLFMVGHRLDGSLSTLVNYDATRDSFAFVANQLTENDLPVLVSDFRSYGDFLIMNIRDPESLNTAYLGVYHSAADSITIEFEEALWNASPPVRSFEVAGGQLFFRKKGSPQTSVRSYDPVNRTVETIPGIHDNDKVEQLEADEGKLLLYTSSFRDGLLIRSFDPSEGTLTRLPIEESFTGDFNGRTFNALARLGEDWYYQGEEDNPELIRYRESDGTVTPVTDIHQGNGQGYPRFLQAGTDNHVYVRAAPGGETQNQHRWLQYDPSSQLYETLLPELEWSFYSKLYQFPGYLVATLVNYEGVDYEAVAFDSISQTFIPVIEASRDCDGFIPRAGGTYIPYDDALYFAHCDGERVQLYRHQFGVVGAEPVSELMDSSLLKGSFVDETIGRLGDDLIIPIGASFSSLFSNDLYRYDGNTFTEIDLGAFNIREPSVVQTPNAVYLSVVRDNINEYFPAYLREGDPALHLMTYEGDTIPRLFPLNFHVRDTVVYFAFGNQILRHTPANEAAELYYDLPDELSNAYSPYVFNDRLYFVAFNASFGSELYEVSDLTEAPLRVSDISAGRPSSSINSFKDNGERLFFAANDGLRGSELWSYQPDCFTIDVAVEATTINWPTGSMVATPNSGTAPFTYRWNTEDTTATLSNLTAGFYEVTITDAAGCSVSQSSWVETNGLVSSTEAAEVSNLTAVAFPNPFRDNLKVRFSGEFSGGATAELFTMNGRLATTQFFPDIQGISLNVGKLPTGFFILRVRDEAGRILLLRKVVKQL